MAKADDLFINMSDSILKYGTDTSGQKVRPIWNDTGEPAYTIKKFGVVNRYNLQEEFPLLTLRKTAFYSAVNEILWIYQKKSNNINDLKPHIWDEWADSNGSIGKAYGYQVAQKHNYPEGEFDQTDRVLYDLKHNPYSRRIMTNLYNHHDLNEMHLYPCCYGVTYNVTDEGYDKLVLNMVLNQRSNDILAANNWNVVQYSALLMMIAQVSNMIPGKLLHVIADAHIYDRHIPIVADLITRETYDAPIVTLDPDITDFYQFTENSFDVLNYQYGKSVGKVPIAV